MFILHEDLRTSITMSRWVRFIIGNFPKEFVKKTKTHILCVITCIPKTGAVCEMMWKNTVKPDRPQMRTQQYNTAHELRMLCSYGYRHTFRLLNAYCCFIILLTWRKWWAPNNASKWQMGFNSAFKGLISSDIVKCFTTTVTNCATTYMSLGSV